MQIEQVRVFKTGENNIGHHFFSLSPDGKYTRTLIHTGFIAPNQSPASLIKAFVPSLDGFPGKDKVVCLGSKVTAVLQNRVIRENNIHPSLLCQIATRFGTKTEHGVGVAGHPKKIQVAIDEVGLIRILFALGVSGLEKTVLKLGLIHKRLGLFFVIAGDQVKGIDGLSHDDGYEHHVLRYPNNERFLSDLLGTIEYPVSLVDINDIGGTVSAITPNCPLTRDEIFTALRDNPFGQHKERTPIAVIGRNC